MFESIDQVDWHSLQDAYGPSGATPGHIRNLASPNKRSRDKSLEKLYFTIYHQGTIYSASVAAIPFLLEIVASPDVADRAPALQLLRALSTGTSYHETHASSFFNREKSRQPEWQEKVREEKSWVAAIHERISAAVPVLANVLRKGRNEERIAAASVLATLRDNPQAAEALVSTCADPDPSVSAAAITAIGSFDNPPAQLLEQCFERASNDLVRTVAAIQILFHRGEESPSVPTEFLLQHLRAPRPELREAYEALPDVGTFLGDSGKALSVAPLSVRLEAFPLLYEQVKWSPYPLNDSETFGLLVLAVMLAPPADRKWTPEKLTWEQRMAIRLVADRAWTLKGSRRSININITDLLESVGLPGEREEVFALLAGTPEGAQSAQEETGWAPKKQRPWWKFF